MVMFRENKKVVLAIYTAVMIAIALMVTFIDLTPTQLDQITFQNNEGFPTGYAPCEMVFNIDEDSLINMTFLLPCENRRQENRMKQMMPKIKNTIIEKMDGKQTAMIRNGELGKFKEEIVAIINEEMDTSFDTIYFHEINLY